MKWLSVLLVISWFLRLAPAVPLIDDGLCKKHPGCSCKATSCACPSKAHDIANGCNLMNDDCSERPAVVAWSWESVIDELWMIANEPRAVRPVPEFVLLLLPFQSTPLRPPAC